MADSSGKLRGLREQMAAAAQALADERRSQSGTSPVPVQSPVSTKTAKPVIDASSLRTDERQRLARERREERERQNAAKESQILEKEKKAKLQYEKQMEEKQKKLEEQRQKDEQKRTAVEEKRKHKEMAEKERREANVRRTMERNSQLDQRQKRWSWGGSVEGDGQGNKRSTSTTNLKQTEIVISKRLSSSSATLQSSSDKSTKQRSSSLSRLNNKTALPSQQLSASPSNTDKKGGTDVKRSSSLGRLNAKRSPSRLEAAKKEDKPAHRPQTNPLESSIISRLLIPTQSSLARSKSSTSVSADGKDSPESHLCPRSASATTISTPPSVSKGPMRSRSIDRLKSSQSPTSGASSTDVTQTPEQEKPLGPAMEKRPASPTTQSGRRRSPSPLNLAKRPSSPTVENKRIQKTRSPSPSLLKQKAASPTVTHKPAPIQRPPLTGNILSTTKKEAESKPKEKAEEKTCSETKSVSTSEKETPAAKTKDDTSSKTISGSTTAEEAAKILAEKRRFAREQREREEQERIRREEEEKIKKEDMARKAEEEAARQKIEAQRLEEERKIKEEEEQQKAQEEKIRREIEEQERLAELQQQKEEAEARALEEAEKQKLEREKIMQQNMKERLERKRRINEIMKRTRKTDQLKNDECTEEDDEMNNLDTNMLEKVNGVDFCDGTDDPEEESPVTTPELISTESLFPSDSVLEQNKLIINGDKPNTEERINGPSETTQVEESLPVANQDLQFNDDDNTTDLIQNLNGKSNTWTFEEYIDLGIHSKSTSLSPDSITADNCHQDLIEGSLPAAPKLAFDEGRANSLSKPIEPAAEM